MDRIRQDLTLDRPATIEEKQTNCNDASLVMGLLDPNYFANGRLAGWPEAYLALEHDIAKPMQLTVDKVTSGIHKFWCPKCQKVSVQSL